MSERVYICAIYDCVKKNSRHCASIPKQLTSQLAVRHFFGAGADDFLKWWPEHAAHRAHMKTDIACWHRGLRTANLEGWYVQLLDGEE